LNSSFSIFFQGFALGASLIIAIGAQNAFVLRQGLRRQYPGLIALICSLSDAVLISLGVAGFGALVARFPALVVFTTWGGALFVFVYGALSFRSAFSSNMLETDAAAVQPASARAVVLATLAFTWLNPHVYLDTVVLIGSIAARFAAPERAVFAFGAVSASFVWFFGLAFGAGWLAPLFRRPLTWRLLDAAIGLVMWAIAFSLVRGVL
jgi:L-lysine exporter family protein LysE/ArgO